jgi:hypothetical protein
LFEEEVVPAFSPEMLKSLPCTSAQALSEYVLLQCTSRPEACRNGFWSKVCTYFIAITGHDSTRSSSAFALRGLTPEWLSFSGIVAEEPEEGKLVITWHHSVVCNDRHYLAHSELAAQVPM